MQLDQNTKRWMELPAYQELMQQVHVDIYVGLKNGADPAECKQSLANLAAAIENSIEFNPRISLTSED